MKILKTKELMKMTGLSSKTIGRHVKSGWLPAPEFKSLGRYGASLYWPEATIKRLLMIKNLKKLGYKNKEINEILLKGAR